VQEGTTAGPPQIHFGVTCAVSNQRPIHGNRYHKIGHEYDLNETAFKRLSPKEQLAFEVIAYPSAKPTQSQATQQLLALPPTWREALQVCTYLFLLLFATVGRNPQGLLPQATEVSGGAIQLRQSTPTPRSDFAGFSPVRF
jgi:hypothetical protein